MWKWNGPILLFCAVSAMVAADSSAADAQQTDRMKRMLEREVVLDHKHSSLADILKEMAEKYGVRAAVEGTPLREKADFSFQGTLREALNRLSERFDYQWRASRSGVILMNKRFTNPDDIPPMLLQEYRQVAKDQLTILPDTAPDLEHQRWGESLLSLARTLTAPQIQALHQGVRLSAADLTPAQRRLFEQAIYARIYGPPRGIWERIGILCSHYDNAYLQRVDPDPNNPGQVYEIWLVVEQRRGQSSRWMLGVLPEEKKP
jgi:hypothetical protein